MQNIDDKIKIFITIKELDSNGKVIREVKQRANSLIGNFFGCFIYLLNANVLPSGITVKDTSNTSRTSSLWLGTFGAASANANYGILLGTGTTAVTMGDYNLATKIAHGTSSGQLQYGAHTANSITGTTTYTWTVTRAFTNSSGASITVNETGLAGYSSYNILWERSVLSSGYAMANGSSYIVQYDFTFSLV